MATSNKTWEARGVIAKLDAEQRRAFGWASVVTNVDGSPVVDHQDDIIPPQELESGAYDFVLNSRSADEMHKRFGVGDLIESVVLTPEKRQAMGLPEGPTAWWVGFHVTDDNTWAGVKAGDLSEFSIFGSGVRSDA